MTQFLMQTIYRTASDKKNCFKDVIRLIPCQHIAALCNRYYEQILWIGDRSICEQATCLCSLGHFI